MSKVNIESIVIVHGKEGSVATLHFSDPMKSCYISGTKALIHTMVAKRVKKVLKGDDDE